MSNIGNYEDRVADFSWSLAEEELGIKEGDPINIGWHISDRICQQGKADKAALIWENHAGDSRTFTYDDLRVLTNGMAKYLEDLGVEAGERVCLFMDRVPELYLGFVAILKRGAIAQPLFSAFGNESLHTRLANAGTSVIFTQKKHVAKVRKIRDQLPNLRHIIIVDGDPEKLREKEVIFGLPQTERLEEYECGATTAETPSVLHYTSGTTGQPKGAQHVHTSIVSQYLTTKWVLDLTDEDVYWCNADPGWVTGTSYGIIGPWACGATQVVLDAGFNTKSWYEFIERRKVTVWYSAPTAIRLLMKEGTDAAKEHDLSSLRHLCSVGEPLNAEAVIWSEEAYGLPFHDTFWQTETGCMMIVNYPGLRIKPGSMGKPFPGITADIIDEETHQPVAGPGDVGVIGLKPDWPSIIRTYWNNPDGYASKFKNDWYLTGDRGSYDKDGYFWFTGRDDDVINTGGHLVGPFEIESALLEHEAVAESAAVAKPDPVNMEVVKAFVTLKPGFEGDPDLELQIMNFIRKKLSPLAMPQEIEFVDKLPKTRSGKIVRRILRAQEFGEPVGDVSTLMDD
ncbi:MAG: acetate--CoA ligase [Planctomycetota bacterium]